MNKRTKQKFQIFIFIIFYVYYLSINQPVRFYMLKSLTSDSTISLDTICDKIIDTRPQTISDIFKILYSCDDRLSSRVDSLARWSTTFQ